MSDSAAWRDMAACRGLDTRLFFPGPGQRPAPEVVAACGACPVIGDCRSFAREHDMSGIWGLRPRRQPQWPSGHPYPVVLIDETAAS